MKMKHSMPISMSYSKNDNKREKLIAIWSLIKKQEKSLI